MGADDPRTKVRSPGEGRGTVRVRITLGALLVVGIALLIAALVMTTLVRRSLTEHVRSAATVRAEAIADQLTDGMTFDQIGISGGDDEFVQIIDERNVVMAASEIVDGAPALVDLDPGETASLTVDFDDDPFLVVATTAETPQGAITVLVGQTLDQVVESTATVTSLLVTGVPALLLFLGVVTWRVVSKALAPVESIRSEVEEISSEQLHRRVPVPASDDEIARLAATMNQMLDRLEEGQQRQRRFVSDASHELRSPVATIRQHAEVALAHPDTTETQDLARLVLAEDLRLQHLVEDLLLLARVDERTSDGKAIIDLDDIVFEEVARARAGTTKKIDVSRVSAGRVLGDRHRLSRLVNNLLENAARHAQSTIAVSLEEQDDDVVLLVDDDGSGIPLEERDRVFERFVRLEDARDRDSGGAGLGLAIVAEVATFHGGVARVSDSSLGGVRLEVRIPRVA